MVEFDVFERSTPLDGVFRALSDPTRRAIVERLADGERNVTELAEPFPMSLAAVSKHLRVLERAGIARQRAVGRSRRYRLDASRLAEADSWLRRYERFWESRLDRLEQKLRSEHAAPARARRREGEERSEGEEQ